jgi:hypothetical protein
MTDANAQPTSASYVDDYMPPTQADQGSAPVADTDTPAETTSSSSDPNSEALEDQNIFDLLGIAQATEDEKEAFLDELQQVIWEDFVEKDVELLLTEDELKEFRILADSTDSDEDARQAGMIEYLENLIPDLEKIMLEKALDLKEDMTRQRITELLEHYKADSAKLETVKKAQSQADQQKWRSVAMTLNAIPA